MNIIINIKNVQHVRNLMAEFNLNDNKVTCITGKNSVGKTTLIRAIKNLIVNNTFQETAAPYIFNSDSSIIYSISSSEMNEKIIFKYSKFIKAIDSNQVISDKLKSLINVELPLPHGDRFHHFRKLSNIDEELRAKIAIGDFQRSEQLISFLDKIYDDNRFEQLNHVDIKNTKYYFLLKDEVERYYIREDYFSSGEYFVVNLFKQIQEGKKLIVIDEIDISLDAMAQVNLVRALRECCVNFETNIVFTTHSLALMKTLKEDELLYMDKSDHDDVEKIALVPRSYNFIKSIMFGFSGFDKYILTEDQCLARYIQFLLSSPENNLFFKYQVIHIGGASHVIDLMNRNSKLEFLSSSNNVLSVLDGDQREKKYVQHIENIVFLPFDNIECEIYKDYLDGKIQVEGISNIKNKSYSDQAKNFYKQITKKEKYDTEPIMSELKVYNYLESINLQGVTKFKKDLLDFLCLVTKC